MNTDWSAGESAALNEFLNTPLGQKWLTVLILSKPRMDLGTTERAALSGAYASGYEAAIGVIDQTRRTRAPEQNASAKSIDPERD
jgi:hypothetical protein